MAWGTPTTIDQTYSTSGATVAATVPGGGVPSGCLIIVCVMENNGTEGGSVSDTAGNTYNLALSRLFTGDGDSFARVYYSYDVAALTSGQSITFTKRTSGDRAGITAFYVTGEQTSSDPYDSAGSKSSASTANNPSITSNSPAESGELFAAFSCWRGASSDSYTLDTGNGWTGPPPTDVRGTGGAGAHPQISGGFQVNSGSGTKTHNPTVNPSASDNASALFIVCFKAAIDVVSFLKPHSPKTMSHIRR